MEGEGKRGGHTGLSMSKVLLWLLETGFYSLACTLASVC